MAAFKWRRSWSSAVCSFSLEKTIWGIGFPRCSFAFVKKKLKKFFVRAHHDDPNKEEGVPEEDDEHGALDGPEVDLHVLGEGALLLAGVGGVVEPQGEPEEGVEDGHAEAEHEEVLVLDGDQGEGVLHLEESLMQR